MVCAATPGTALVEPAGAAASGRATAGSTRAVPGVSAQTTPAQTVSWSIPILYNELRLLFCTGQRCRVVNRRWAYRFGDVGWYNKWYISFHLYHNSFESVSPVLSGTAWTVVYAVLGINRLYRKVIWIEVFQLYKITRYSVGRQTCKTCAFYTSGSKICLLKYHVF